MARYRVLRSTHADANGTHKRGDVVESDIDLAERFGANKFEKLPPDKVFNPLSKAEVVAQAAAASPAPPTAVPYTEEELRSLTVADLRELAEDAEIELPSNAKKDEIISTLLGKS